VLSIYRFLASTIGPTIARLVLGRNPKTSNTLAERFGTEGLPDSLPPGRRVWLNAASVGETMAALPFVEEWRKRFPDDRILLTNTTVTGFTRVREKLGGAIAWHGYGPLDLPVTISRFLKRLNPDVYITVEAEAWPNLLADLGRAGVPRILINGRMTLANKRGLKRSITLAIWKLFDFISARSEKDYNAFLKLGIPNDLLAIGFGKLLHHNIELIRNIPTLLSAGRPVMIGASRKRMLGEITGRPVDERLSASIAVALLAIDLGASIIRVHDVKETVDAIKVRSAIMDEQSDPQREKEADG